MSEKRDKAMLAFLDVLNGCDLTTLTEAKQECPNISCAAREIYVSYYEFCPLCGMGLVPSRHRFFLLEKCLEAYVMANGKLPIIVGDRMKWPDD